MFKIMTTNKIIKNSICYLIVLLVMSNAYFWWVAYTDIKQVHCDMELSIDLAPYSRISTRKVEAMKEMTNHFILSYSEENLASLLAMYVDIQILQYERLRLKNTTRSSMDISNRKAELETTAINIATHHQQANSNIVAFQVALWFWIMSILVLSCYFVIRNLMAKNKKTLRA